MLRILALAIRYNMSAQAANLPNLLAGTLGMVINNLLLVIGLWSMLFAGKPANEPYFVSFLMMNIVLMLSWGALCFFCGGWIDLGELIVNGQFESKLATPRSPLLLTAGHNVHPAALGDFAMGILGLIYLGPVFGWDVALRALIASLLSIAALFGVFATTGSLAFFIPRGDTIAMLLRELTLSFSCMPIKHALNQSWGRIVLLLSPAVTVTFLPVDFVLEADLRSFAIATFGALASAGLGLLVFRFGVRRYQALNRIGAQN